MRGPAGYLDPNLGARLRELRGELGQGPAAAMVGVQGGVLSRWETGERVPTIQFVVPLAKALGVSTDYLLTGNGPLLPRGSLIEALQVRKWCDGAVAECCAWSHRGPDPGRKAWLKRLAALEAAILEAQAEFVQDGEIGQMGAVK